jgi:hypothetical protein
MTQLRRRLTIPAQPLLVRERLRLVCPPMLHAGEGPPLLSYSDAGFIEDFLVLASRSEPIADEDLPELLVWRDWSEPPRALLDARGGAVYSLKRIRRVPPPGLREAIPGPALGDPRTVDLPPGTGPKSEPPWLRKLYLPQHERFTVVCVDAICDRFGTPPLDRRRVKEAGMVVRRLKPTGDLDADHWEDWFPDGKGEGSWLERYDADLHLLERGEATPVQLDPVADRVQSHPLRLIPEDMDPRRITPCRLYGYLPVWSSERQRHAKEEDRRNDRQQTRKRLLAQLLPAWKPLGARSEPVLALLRLTLLPGPAGTVKAVAKPDQIDDLVPLALERLVKAALDPSRFAKDVQGDCADAATLWLGEGLDGAADLAMDWLRSASFSPSLVSAVDDQLRQRLLEVVEIHLSRPADSGLSATQWSMLLAAALVRARGHLLALARAIELMLAASQPGFRCSAEEEWLALLPGQLPAGSRPARPGAAVHSLGGLLDGLARYRQADGSVRIADQSPTFAMAGLSPRVEAVLGHLLDLRHQLAPVARQLGAVDSSVRAVLSLRSKAMESALLRQLSLDQTTTDLAHLGVPLDEDPAEGLLVAPGLHPTSADLNTLIKRAASLDKEDKPFAEAVKNAEEASTELRYDGQHLYAVWCWLRVGGRGPCERERLIWSKRSEPFRIAEPHDLLGVRPVSLSMPDLPALVKDMDRIRQARARPYAAVHTPPQSGFVAQDLSSVSRRMGVGGTCSFGIPVFTICALVMFSIVFAILSLVLRWLPLLQICTPTVDDSSSP